MIGGATSVPLDQMERIEACPLCGSRELRPYGAAWREPDALHAVQARCAGCGLLVSTPRPHEIDRDRYYRERYYEEQWPDAARVFHDNVATHAARDVARIERLAGERLKAGGRTLDVGSGYSATVEVLRRKGFRAFGTELSPHACAFAHGQGLTVVRSKMPWLPFRDATFDLVTSAHVIEHVGDPRVFVRELARLVTPGGLLAVVTDHVAASQYRWDRIKAMWRGRPPFQTSTDHTFVFAAHHLRDLLAGAGCADIAVDVYHHPAPYERWHWRAYKSVFRAIDRIMGWGPYQLAIGVRAR